MNTLDILENLAEILMWIGLVIGGLCLFGLLVMQVSAGRWLETDAVMVDGTGEPRLRWMSSEGLHEHVIHENDHRDFESSDGIRVYYSARNPHRYRFERIGHGEKLMRMLTWLFLGIGMLALIVSIVLIFVPAAD
ncbi:hypothetical protein [Leifsonia sp. A12D58]|uniref:hypothetical protein n=1 Tax=Leifsonia sp. A12D58 TaxID=3397674 RepID=UPI0039E00903